MVPLSVAVGGELAEGRGAPVSEEGRCCEMEEPWMALWALSAIEVKKLGGGIFEMGGKKDKIG